MWKRKRVAVWAFSYENALLTVDFSHEKLCIFTES